MQVYVQPRVIRTPIFVMTSIRDYVPHDSDISTKIPAYPFVSTANAASLDVNPMSPVPRYNLGPLYRMKGRGRKIN